MRICRHSFAIVLFLLGGVGRVEATTQRRGAHQSEPNATDKASSSNDNDAPPTPVVKYFSKARHDQSGRQVLRFFQLDAATSSLGRVMGGLCPNFSATPCP